jgi:hypothetical protein
MWHKGRVDWDWVDEVRVDGGTMAQTFPAGGHWNLFMSPPIATERCVRSVVKTRVLHVRARHWKVLGKVMDYLVPALCPSEVWLPKPLGNTGRVLE